MSVGRIRKLAPSEQIFAMSGTYLGYSVCMHGTLDVIALSTAFAALRQRYPVLAASLEEDDDGYAIVAPSGPLAGVVVTRCDTEAPITNVGADQRRALSGLHVAHDGNRAAVTLLTHHSIADGYHSIALLADLWSLYTDVIRGESLDTTPYAYPESLEKLLAERGIFKDGATDACASPPGPAAPRPRDIEVRFTVAHARCRLDEDVTSALSQFARRHGTTLNGLVSAAILHVEAKLRGVSDDSFCYTYPVNLRSRVSPPISIPAATDPLGFADFTPVPDVADVVEVARAINLHLRKGLETREIHQAGLSYFDRLTTRREVPESEQPVLVMSTNWGVLPALRAPETIVFEDFRSLMSDSPMVSNAPPLYILMTFQGRLAIELRNPADRAGARELITAIESVLLNLIPMGVRDSLD